MFVNFDYFEELRSKRLRLSTKSGVVHRFIDGKKQKSIEKALAEIKEFSDHSWYKELYRRNSHRLGKVAILYRGTTVTYGEMFDKMKDYAKALKQQGVSEQMEVPMCISNTPELIYFLGAISMIGARANIFGEKFDHDYVREIIHGCDSPIAIIEDSKFSKLGTLINALTIQKIIVPSICSSLPNGVSPYAADKKHGMFVDRVSEALENNSKAIRLSTFVESGRNYIGNVETENVTLDSKFLTTYTSGSTNSRRPKQIVQTNKSFVTIARFHDKDKVHIDMSKFVVEALIPTYSNSDIISSVSDALMQGSTVALEPVYDENFFLDSLLINKSNYCVATTSFWLRALKRALYDDRYRECDLKNLIFPFSAGEPMSIGEEIFLNWALNKKNAGKKFLGGLLPSTRMSTAGGDCEHGGLFYKLFRTLSNRRANGKVFESGMKLMDFAEARILDLDTGEDITDSGRYGELIVRADTVMAEYKNDPIATSDFFDVPDPFANQGFGKCCVYCFKDKTGYHIKGRIPNKREALPTFVINDLVLSNHNLIMSSSTNMVCDSDGNDYTVIDYETLPWTNLDSDIVDKEIYDSIREKLGKQVAAKLRFRHHTFCEGFPLNLSGKRDNRELVSRGLNDTRQISLSPAYIKK